MFHKGVDLACVVCVFENKTFMMYRAPVHKLNARVNVSSAVLAFPETPFILFVVVREDIGVLISMGGIQLGDDCIVSCNTRRDPFLLIPHLDMIPKSKSIHQIAPDNSPRRVNTGHATAQTRISWDVHGAGRNRFERAKRVLAPGLFG